MWTLQKFRSIIWGCEIQVVTDHHALCWLLSKSELKGRLARWSALLQGENIKIIYKSGKSHLDADALSRNPVGLADCESDSDEDSLKIFALEQLDLTEELSEDATSGAGALTSKQYYIQQEQKSDPWCANIIRDLDDVYNKRISPSHRKYEVINGKLYRKVAEHSLGHGSRLCVPSSMRLEVLQTFHDYTTAGHLGKDRTTERIVKRFYWPNMYTDIREYVRSCIPCQTRKSVPRKPAGLMMYCQDAKYIYRSADLDGIDK